MGWIRSFGILLVLLAAACSTRGGERSGEGRDGGPGGTDTGTTVPPGALRLDPATAEVSVSRGIPAVLTYRAFLVGEGGSEQEVTDEASFSLTTPELGSFAGSTFTSSTERSGRTRVIAMARGATGMADLTVLLEHVVIGPGAGEDAPGKFGGADDPSRAPEIVYPNDGVIVPPNLNELELHFLPAGNTLFELHFQGSALDLRVYLGCTPLGAGCVYTPDEAVWTLLAEAERGSMPVTYRLSGVDGAAPAGVGRSADRTIEFAEEDIVGGLYYWNAGAGAIRRYDFGRRGQVAENYMDAARAGAMTCVGCHAVARDGSRIAIGMDIPAPSPYKVYAVGDRSEYYAQGTTFGGGSNFFSFSPDASQIMTSNGASIVLRSADDGSVITDPLVAQGAMPDWSPDGMRMVYSRPSMAAPCFGGFCGAPGVDSASLESMVFDGSSWSAGPQLVAFGGQNNYYPTYSPDGGWVLFNRSPANNNSFDAPDAELWVVSAEGGAPMRLERATSTNGDSWPKWDPTLYVHQGRALMWMTFSSRRAYGLRLAAGDRAQLWMTAFDPSGAEAGTGGDRPGFWLPFQEIESGNHIGQWVTSVDRQPCSGPDTCPGGEFCEDGVCVADLI